MSSPFASKRKARIVGQSEDEPPSDTPMSGTDSTDQEPLFRRPSQKSKKRSSTRLSFGPPAEDDEPTSVFTPKKSALSRAANERNTLRKTASLASLKQRADASSQPPSQQSKAQDDPDPAAATTPSSSSRSYSKAALDELKSSTPSTPRPQRSASPSTPATAPAATLDIAAKFGSDLTKYESRGGATHIPSETEIAEKKARRARLAREQRHKAPRRRRGSNSSDSGSNSDDNDDGEDVSDDPRDRDSDDDEFRSHRDTISLSQRPSRGPHKLSKDVPAGRLAAHDDEDLLDDSTQLGGTMESGAAGTRGNRIQLGRAAEREAQARQRAQMAELISEAERASSSSSEASSSGGEEGTERDRRAEYDAAQTRAGMAGLWLDGGNGATGRRDRGAAAHNTPPKITPLPTLAGCADRLTRRINELQETVAERVRGLEQVEVEREEIKAQEEGVQKVLDEVIKQWKDMHGGGDGDDEAGNDDVDMDMDDLTDGRAGLGASLGAGLGASLGSGFGSGLGSSMRAGLGSGLGFNGISGEERGLESLGGTPVKSRTPLREVNGLEDEG